MGVNLWKRMLWIVSVPCIMKPNHTKLKIFLPRPAVFQFHENIKNENTTAGPLWVYWWSRGFMSLRVAAGHATRPNVRPHLMVSLLTSFVDPHWFQYRSGSSIFGQCGSGSRSRGIWWPKMGKNVLLKNFFRSKGLRKGRPIYMRSLQKITSCTSEISSLLRVTFIILFYFILLFQKYS